MKTSRNPTISYSVKRYHDVKLTCRLYCRLQLGAKRLGNVEICFQGALDVVGNL